MTYHSEMGDISFYAEPAVHEVPEVVVANPVVVTGMAMKAVVVEKVVAVTEVVETTVVVRAVVENAEEKMEFLRHERPCLHRSESVAYGM
jgi:hypothetical protein